MRVKLLFALILVFALTGCSGSSGDPDAGDGDADGDGNGNPDGLICQNDQQCPNDMKCRNGICEEVITCDCNSGCGSRDSGLICNRGSHECEAGTAPADQCSDDCDCYANETCAGGAGCVPTGGDGDCTSDTDCQQGEKCLNGNCVPDTCTTRDDCTGPVCLVCTNGECTTPPAVCQGDEQCCVGFHCNFGVCIEDNADECRADADCTEDPDKPHCVDGVCMPWCMSDLDCPGGQICIDNECVSPGCTPGSCPQGQWCDTEAANGMGACFPGCESNDDCNPGETCDYGTHQCMAGCCNPPCQANEYCDTQDCQCKTKCQNDADCGAGFKCNQVTGECEPEGGGEFSPCSSDEECAEGLLCDMCTIGCDPVGLQQCLIECAMTTPCPRADLECKFRRLNGAKWMCVPTSP
jgi:hypothetical protein